MMSSAAQSVEFPGASKARTRLGLDAVNFMMADLQTGVGPFLAVYLTSARHWTASRVGLIVAVQSIVTVVVQAPAGALVDWSRHKKWLLVIGAALIGLGCFGVVRADATWQQLLDQSVIGIAAALFIPAVASVSLGVVGARGLPRRIGRNEALNHAGNVSFALAAGYIGVRFGQGAIFVAAAFFSWVTAVAAAALIRARDVDDREARGLAASGANAPNACAMRELLRRGPVRTFIAMAFIYFLANGAMLPLVGELLTHGRGVASSYLSACVIVAQLTMVPVAIVVSRRAARRRKPIFAAAFLVLSVRGLCYVFGHGQYYLVSLQVLDAIGAGIFGVLWPVVAADLTRGTGRFNFLQGVVQAAVGLGIFVSNVAGGYAVRAIGFDGTFGALAALALVGFVLFVLLMPETAPDAQAWRGRKGDVGLSGAAPLPS